jgi:pimeloyl-ACP methyl ester carboxylesterase
MTSSKSKQYVILLHGLGRSRLSMRVLARRLRAANYSVLNFGYPSRRKPLDEHAALLDTFLTEQVPTPATIHFVTHSLGAIVTRQYLTNHYAKQTSNPMKLGRAVFLGPPSQGSQLAKKLEHSRLFTVLMGPVLTEVANLSLPEHTDKLEIGIISGGTRSGKGYSPLVAGDNDGIVSVQESRLEGAKDWITIRGIHTLLMYQSAVGDHILHFLEHGKFKDSIDPAAST